MKHALISVKGTVVNSKPENGDEWVCVPGIVVSTNYGSSIRTDFFGNFTMNEVIDIERGPLELTFESVNRDYRVRVKEILVDDEAGFHSTNIMVKLYPIDDNK